MYCDHVRSSSECESAALKLGLADITVRDESNHGPTHITFSSPYCYFYEDDLRFNNLKPYVGDNMLWLQCNTFVACICRQNYVCAKIPCGEGHGDCDHDNECEGSLVCGHLNCANSSITDCCTHTCSNDYDCISGECHVEHNQCRLNSNTIDWSKCSPDSPCTDNEGDCDHDTDCSEALICGTDNCANGPAGMDCCTYDEGN